MSTKLKYNSPCYYCGEAASRDEHAPPDHMFKDFNCDRITVPSCAIHNNVKGADDQAMVCAFLLSLYDWAQSDPWYMASLEPEIQIAIRQVETSLRRTKRRVKAQPIIKTQEDAPRRLPNVVHLDPTLDWQAWMRQLTAALVFDATKAFDSGINWNDALVYCPDYIPGNKPVPAQEFIDISDWHRRLKASINARIWKAGWSASPRPYPLNIYHFRLNLDNNKVCFEHRFYNRYTFYVSFEAGLSTVGALWAKTS